MKKRIRTTRLQRDTLTMLRVRFAEEGCFIFPVAKWYRRHRLDFVAANILMPQKLVVIRPGRNNTISIRPFCQPDLYTRVRTLLTELQRRTPVRLQWSNRQLPHAKHRPDWWTEYIPPAAQREFAYLDAGRPLLMEQLGFGAPPGTAIH